MKMYINPYKRFHGSFIPEWLERMKGITPGAKICYARLCRYAGKNGMAYPKNDTLAEAIGVSDRQIRRYITELEESKLIETKQRGFGKPNLYYFLEHDFMDATMSEQERTDTSEPERTETSGQEWTHMSGQERTSTSVPYIEDNHIEDNQFKRINGKEDAHSREPNHFEKASEVLLYLNEVTGKNLIPNLTNKRYIAERISEGRAVVELKEIIDLKYAQSQRTQKNGQPIFAPKFLRPQTLFSEQNCEKYINEINEIKSGKSNGFEFEGSHSKQQRRLEALRSAGIDPLAMFGYD